MHGVRGRRVGRGGRESYVGVSPPKKIIFFPSSSAPAASPAQQPLLLLPGRPYTTSGFPMGASIL